LNNIYTFDDIENALVTLFSMTTADGWGEIALSNMSSVGIDYEQSDHIIKPAWLAFYMVFMLLGCFFFINLFVGVVVSTFNSEHDKLGGNNLLTDK